MRVHLALRRGLIYLLPLALLFVALTGRVVASDLLERLSLFCFDLYQKAAPREAGDAPIRVVDIDDPSLKKIGQWPWPRTVVAQLVDRLREAGAAVIAFDIDFAEPDRTSPTLLLPLLGQNGVGNAEAERLLAALPDPDQRLAEAIGALPVVTGFILTERGETRPPLPKAGFAFAGEDPLGHVDRYPAVVANLPGLEAVAAGNGFLNQYPDWDDVVRRVPLVLRLGEKPYPSLAAEVLRVALGARSYVGRAAGANAEMSFGEKTGLTAIRIGQLTIPTDDAGRVWLHYAVRRRDRVVSAADVLSGKFDPALFKDDIVLVGTSALGIVNDVQATPIAPDVPGVEIHAQLLEQILGGAFLVRPDWAVGAEISFTLLVGIGLILALPRIGALPSALLGGASVAIAFGASWFLFRHAQLLIDPVFPWAVMTLVYLVSSLLGYLRTEARQREIRGAFSHYMSPYYVDELAAHPERLKLGGQARIMTIMFCDIRGFTSLSEKLDAETLTYFMNSFLSPMTEIITERKGTIDKYIGDCIMAFWNAPLDDPDQCHKCGAGDAPQARRSQPPLAGGSGLSGLSSGTDRHRHQHRRMRGRQFRLAPALRLLAARRSGESRFAAGRPGKVYGIDLMIGEETGGRLGDPTLIEVDLVAVKGKTEAGCIYTLPPERIVEDQFIDQHSALLGVYRRQDWASALRLLDDFRLAAARFLAPVYDLYRHRIAQFQIKAPPADWKGMFTAEEK